MSDDNTNDHKKSVEDHLKFREGPSFPLTPDRETQTRREAYQNQDRNERLIQVAEKLCHKDTLRDQFAASALQGLIAHFMETYCGDNQERFFAEIAQDAYAIAENMLIARSKYVKWDQ